MIKESLEDKLALAALVIAAWLLGGMFGVLRVFPFPQLIQGASDFFEATSGSNDRPKLLKKIEYPEPGLVVNDRNLAQPGLTIVQGFMPGGNQVRVLDQEGREIHRWTLDFFELWPDAENIFPKARIPASNLHFHSQGMSPRSDGSIVVNFSGLGAALLDRCSEPIWRADNWMHHSVTPAEADHFWIPGHIPLSETPEDYLPRDYSAEMLIAMRKDGYSGFNNSALLIGPEGKVVRQLSVLKAVFDAGLEHAIYSSFREKKIDPTHLNDIEVVTEALAAKIEGVEQGDLLLSIRNMNMLAIIDEVSGDLKWHQQGPWVRQHDVDITADGNIDIFNNRSKEISQLVETSQIVRFDPEDRSTELLFPIGASDEFFTNIMGTHQALENGNRLITESTAGRVFEVTPQGQIVWDYRLPYDDYLASLFAASIRVDDDFFEAGSLGCVTQE